MQETTDTGIEIGGVVYTTGFITGGLVGLDGIHRTDLGYAVLANAFIEAINAAYGSAIPLADLHSFVDPSNYEPLESAKHVGALP